MQLKGIIAALAAPSLALADDNFADAEAILFEGSNIERSGDTNFATVEP
ncbi:MAG: hypothetical protein ACON38_11380 [Akkermansiaceae bacterium]